MKCHIKPPIHTFTVLAVLLVTLITPVTAFAVTQSLDVTDASLQVGMLTSLSKNANVAEPASDKNAASLVGVRVADDTTTLERQPGQVSVSDSGQASVLVSTLNGDIAVGDRLAVSTIVGVGAKATTSSWTVGVAQASFSSKTTGAVASDIIDSSGAKRRIWIGNIPAVVQVSYFNKSTPTLPKEDSQVPARLQTAADSIAGKRASVLAIVLSFILLIMVLVIAGIIISSAVRGGMVAIGRQPLAKRAITRQTFKSASISLAVLFVGIIGAFILLRIF